MLKIVDYDEFNAARTVSTPQPLTKVSWICRIAPFKNRSQPQLSCCATCLFVRGIEGECTLVSWIFVKVTSNFDDLLLKVKRASFIKQNVIHQTFCVALLAGQSRYQNCLVWLVELSEIIEFI